MVAKGVLMYFNLLSYESIHYQIPCDADYQHKNTEVSEMKLFKDLNGSV